MNLQRDIELDRELGTSFQDFFCTGVGSVRRDGWDDERMVLPAFQKLAGIC
jgi:hypothetical protein